MTVNNPFSYQEIQSVEEELGDYLEDPKSTLKPLRYQLPYDLTWKDVMYQFSSVTQSCLTLCNPMDHSTPGLPVHYQITEPTQTHVP